MRGLLLAVCLTVFSLCSSKWVSMEPETFHERLETALDILNEVPLIDGHNDLASNIHDVLNNQLHLFPFDQNLTTLEPWASDTFSQTDLPSLFEGMVGAQFWSAWVPCKISKSENVITAMEQIDVIKRLIERYPEDLQFADSTDGILNAFGDGKIASLIGVEGGHTINNSLAVLRTFYDSGVRYLTLTHNCNTAWAESGMFPDDINATGGVDVEGLTDFGELVIGEMNRLGMIVDLSHTSDETVNDVLAVAAAPVMFSHSSARELCNNSRNVPDDILMKVKRNGGIVMVNFYPPFLTCSDNATIYDVIDHINHIRNVTGIDHVGIGSDFNGISKVPEGLENVSKYPNLFAELLLDPMWTRDDLKKLAGLNFLRVFRLVESVKHVLNGESPIENIMAGDEEKK